MAGASFATIPGVTTPAELATDNDERSESIVGVLAGAFGDLIEADARAFRHKFRKMAASPFAFYRGSAPLFYADVVRLEDPWADERTSRVWIQGDLHAENFGTYMDAAGILVFDVNDFDEAYLGHFTWDLRRMAASLALLGFAKALSDEAIERMIQTYGRAYLEQVRAFAAGDRDSDYRLTLENTDGVLHEVLLQARLETRVALLDATTTVERAERHFSAGSGVRRLEEDERQEVEQAFAAYLETIPEVKRQHSVSYSVKDVVGRAGFGIGSAGLPAYSLLVEGRTQALENDVVLSMKQGNVAAPSRVVDDPAIEDYFEHPGHRTAVSQRALQAHADPWLGWCELRGVGQVVKEVSPVRGRHRLGPGVGSRRDDRAAGQPRAGDGQGPLRVGRGQRADAGGLPDRGGDHGRRRGARGRVRRRPRAVRPCLRRPRARRPPAVRRRVPQRPDPGGAGGLTMGGVRFIAPLLLAAAGAAVVVALVESAGGDFGDWPLWQAIAVPAAAFAVPAVLSAWSAWRYGVLEALLWAVVCVAVQAALVLGVGFLALGYGPA